MGSQQIPDLSKVPALKPPPGIKPDFQHPGGVGTAIIVVNAVFLGLMVICLAARIYVKTGIIRAFWWDDAMIVLGAMGSFVHSVLVMYQTRFGVGSHQWNVPLSHFTPSFIHTLTAGDIVYDPTVMFIKLSMVLLYRRIFAINQIMNWITYGLIAFLLTFYVAELSYAIAVEALCTAAPPYPSICTNEYINTVFQACINVITDFVLLGIPIAMVFNLQMPLKRKIRLSAIFGVGLLACIGGLIRMIYVIIYAHSGDGTYIGGFLSIFSAIEINLGIIAACLIALPPIAKRYPLRSISSWSFTSLRSRLLRRSGRKSVASDKKATDDSFGGVSLHLPTAGGFTELHETSKSEASTEENLGERNMETGRYHTEGFGV